MAQEQLAVGAATAVLTGQTANGDAWFVRQVGDVCRVALIDGVGHGELAALAASCAREVLEETSTLSAQEVLHVCHQRLRSTRGAVAAIATIDVASSKLTFAGVGNIEARLWQNGREQRLISYRGLLGTAIPTLRAFECTLSSPWLLVLHTDGVSGRASLDPDDLAVARDSGVEALAQRLLERWGRSHDDATVVVVGAVSIPPW